MATSDAHDYSTSRRMEKTHATPPHTANPRALPRAVGLAAASLLSVSEIVLFVFLTRFDILPARWLIPGGAALAILTVLLFAGAGMKPRGIRVICSLLALLLTGVITTGCVIVGKAIQTLDRIFMDDAAFSYHVSAIVPTDDPARSMGDTAGYTFGILSAVDRRNTDEAIALAEQDSGSSLTVSEYASCLSLVGALYAGDVDAILLNEGYRELLLEAYPAFPRDARILCTYSLARAPDAQGSPSGDDEAQPHSDNANGGTVSNEDDPEKPRDSFVMFLTGIDTYGATETVSRSDVNILAVVNPESRQILLITTPRDAYVPLPMADNSMDKLTHAALYGGVEASMMTLAQLYEVSVDYYVRVNFTGFSTIVDSLGGIDVNSEVAFSDQGFSYEQGTNHLDGEAALAFVRARYPFPDGDFQRGRNQMAAIRAILDKVMSPTILTAYMSLMDSISDCFTTSFPDSEITKLVRMQLRDGASWSICAYEVRGWGDTAYCYSLGDTASVVYLEDSSISEAQQLIRRVYAGETLG